MNHRVYNRSVYNRRVYNHQLQLNYDDISQATEFKLQNQGAVYNWRQAFRS